MERGCKNRTLFTLEMVFIQYQNLEPHSPYCVTVTFKWSLDEIFDNEFYLPVKMPLLQRVFISSKVTHIIYMQSRKQNNVPSRLSPQWLF